MPQLILLDTHIWFWWINLEHDRLPSKYLEELATAERAAVASISCFEIALSVQKNNLALTVPMSEWFIDALTASGIELLTLTPGIAERAVKLSEVHRDPFDRIIMATALEHEAKLLSLDGKFRHYPEVKQFLL